MLEKELAVGAGLVRMVEDLFPKARSPHSKSPIRRPRRLSLDFNGVPAVTAWIIRGLTSLLNGGAADIVTVSVGTGTEVSRSSEGRLAVLQIPGPLLAGQTGERLLLIENQCDYRTGEFTFEHSDLLAVSSGPIGADYVRFDPASLSIPPRGIARVLVSLTIPKNTPSGSYEGSFRCQGLNVDRTLIRVIVA